MSGKILIVEDEQDVVKLLRIILESHGYQCFDVNSGEKVFDFLDNQRVDVILLDIILPGIDGYEVCRRLKTRRQTNMIPVIILTARAFPEDMEIGLSVQADKYLTKPFEQDALLKEVKRQIDKKQRLKGKGLLGEIEFSVASDLRYFDQLNEMVSVLLEHSPLDENSVTDIKYVLGEMYRNAVEWGNKKKKDLHVKINYRLENHKLTIIIKDEGAGFNFERYINSSYSPAAEYKERERAGRRSGGLGIMLARTYMDRVTYNEFGNEVTLVKNFHDPAR